MEATFKLLADTAQLFIVVGDFMLDKVTIGSLKGIANEAPIPVFKEGASKYLLGGAGNVCANLAALGSSSAIAAVGLVGADSAGAELRSLCNTSGILTHSLVTDSQRPTTCKHRYYINNRLVFRSDNESTDSASVAAEFEIMNAVVKLVEDSRVMSPLSPIKIILSDYNKGCLTDKLRQSIIFYAKGENIETFVDPKTDLVLYRGCTFIKPNKSEVMQLGRINVEEVGLECAHKRLHEIIECKYSLITLAEAGMSLGLAPAAGAAFYHRSTDTQLEVIDVTGAGDVVLSLMAYMWGFGLSYMTCLDIANTIARRSVMHCGTYVVRQEDWQGAVRQVLAAATASATVAAIQIQPQQTLVFTNGCFDLLHVGHLRLLADARAAGDRLIVGINSDKSVQRLKGPTRPIRTAEQRAEMLRALPWVDEVVVFDEDTPFKLLKRLQPRPNILVKGGDYQLEDIVGRELVDKVIIFPFLGSTSCDSSSNSSNSNSSSSIIASVLSHHR